MQRVVLLDADTLVYEAARANEYEVQWDQDLWTLQAHLEPALAHLEDAIGTIVEKLKADRVIMALSDYTRPWRQAVMPTYKAQRRDTRKPIIWRPLREYLHETYDTRQIETLEGDDVLGILLTEPGVEEERVLVSIDKDMKTLPGLHVNLMKARKTGEWEPWRQSVDQADYFHLLQALMGDTTDGYPGCPKVGPKGAEKILAPFAAGDALLTDTAWPAIVAAYEKAGLSEQVALQNARVARICRYTDYDHEKKEVILWQPQ